MMRNDRTSIRDWAPEILDFTTTAFAIKDLQGTILDANPAFCALLGYPREELVGKNHALITHPEDLAQTDLVLSRFATGELTDHTWTKRYVLKDTSVILCRQKLTVFHRDTTGSKLILQVEDISAQQMMSHACVEAEARYQTTIDSASDLAILSLDLGGTIQIFSRGAELLFGTAATRVLGSRDLIRFLDPDEVRARELELSSEYGSPVLGMEVLLRAVRAGQSERRAWTVVRQDGKRLPASLTVSPVLTREGECTGFILLGRDISAEIEARRKLFRAMESAEVANQAKSRFLANMSHEIRTPLNGVLGIAQVLAESGLTPVQREYLEMIQTSGQSLQQIINDILDFSKIEAGRMDIQHTAFSHADLLKALVSLFQMKAQEKGLVFQVGAGTPVPEILVGDPLRIQQILVNLIGNAVKFTESGTVSLTVRYGTGEGPDGDHWEAEVRDTGIGMSREQVDNLFQPFVQADHSITQKFGGTGLGLAISRQLALLMDGSLTAESRTGEGSVFRLTLPLKAAVPRAGRPLPDTPAPGGLDGLRVLLVEDGVINQVVAQALLEKAGAQVEVRSNGKEAVEALRYEPDRYDVILMDIQMPEMNGLDATRILRRELGVKTPIIALTAGAMADERARCLKSGMVDFLPKPFKKTEILGIIARHAGGPGPEVPP